MLDLKRNYEPAALHRDFILAKRQCCFDGSTNVSGAENDVEIYAVFRALDICALIPIPVGLYA